jgi:hypothetical protein
MDNYDFNNDGNMDLVVGFKTSVYYYLGVGDGTFGPATTIGGPAGGYRQAISAPPVLTPPCSNQPPEADPGGPYLGAVDTTISLDGTGSSDPDDDSLIYAWDFGDSETGTGATPNHTYTEPGIYDVCLTVNDGSVDSEQVCTIAVVYDPDGGFVSGGGWIDSPANIDYQYMQVGGKATFGFVSKYKKDAETPTGQTEFQFNAGNLNFHSKSYQWLVVAGANAKYKGDGTINGGGNYGFMLTATDAALTSSTDVDEFRIKIWDKDDSDAVVYDNKPGESDESYDGTAIGGGSIVIHKAKK